MKCAEKHFGATSDTWTPSLSGPTLPDVPFLAAWLMLTRCRTKEAIVLGIHLFTAEAAAALLRSILCGKIKEHCQGELS